MAVLDSAWFESLLADALDSEQIQAALKKALETQGAENLVETLFDSGLVDDFVDRLVADGTVWVLINAMLESDGAEELISNGTLWSVVGKAVASDGAGQLANSSALWSLIDSALASDGARQLIANQALWTLIDNALQSPGASRLVNSPALWTLVNAALEGGGAHQLLDSGALWTLIARALRSPGAKQLVSTNALWSLIDKALESDGADRLVAKLFDSGLADHFVDRLLASEAVWRLVDEIAASPAVTSAVTQQSLSFADQFGDEMRARSRKADDWLLEAAHRHQKTKEASASLNGSGPEPSKLERPAAPVMPTTSANQPTMVEPDARRVGIVSRTIAFSIDAALISLAAFVIELGAVLIVSVVHLPTGLKTAMVAAGTALFALWAMAYFVVFWSTTGQSPGARIMQFRVVPTQGDKLKPRRAAVRCIGLVLAAIPLFAGYLPVAFARRRRGLHDYIARTIVVDAPRLSLAEQRRLAARSQRTIDLLVTGSPHSHDAAVVCDGEAAAHPDQLTAGPVNRNGERGRTYR